MMKKVLLLALSLMLSAIVVAGEKSVYEFNWLDKDKEIYVLQNRRFRKSGSFYVGATGVKTLSGAFIDSYGGSARAGFFFREDWGVEFAHGKNSGSENDTAKGVLDQTSVPYYRKIDSYTGAMLMWSPFYSKINTFNRIFYFDWMLGLGAASIKTLDNSRRFANTSDTSMTSENLMGVLWNTGLRFYINESWSVRVDITGLNYQAKKSRRVNAGNELKTNKVFSNYDLGLGLNYAF